MATSKFFPIFGGAAILAIAATSWAQAPQTQQQRENQPLADQQGQMAPQRHEMNKPVIANALNSANSADAIMAGSLIVDNQGEIALGKLAGQKAKDKDVKEFGEKMVKDHTDFMQKLERFANVQASQAEGRAAVVGTQTVATEPAVPGSTTQPLGSQPFNFVQLKQEIGQKCLDMEQKDLNEKEGTQFDKCYIGAQIGAHMHVLATLEVFRNQASPELALLLDKGIETTKMHLEHAQKIAKALEKE